MTRKTNIWTIASFVILGIFLFTILPYVTGYDTDSKNIGNGVNILFVDINNPTCSDSYTRAQALNGATPWCTLDAPLTNSKIQSGDTLYIAEGEYNGESDISGRTITSSITISAYPGDTVDITRYYTGGQATTPNSLWTSSGNNIWYTTLSSSTVTRPAVYHKDTTKFFTWNTYSAFAASTYPENSYYDSSSRKLYVKFSSSMNPNNVPIYIVNEYQPIYISGNTMSTNAYITLKNLNFKYIYYGTHLYDQSNVIIENCNIYGGYNGISVDGRDNSKNKNIIIRNNYLNGKQNPIWYGEDMKNEFMEETSGLYVQDFAGRIEATSNVFTYWHGGVLLSTNSPKECDNSEISYNNFTYGRGSQIEIENYCSNTKYHHNLFYQNTYAGVSFAPANADAGQCTFSYNVIISKGQQHWSSSLDYDNYAIKAQSRSSSNISNWLIDHNTFYGYGRVLNTMSLEGGNLEGAWAKTTWTNNIFYAETEYVLFRTGLASSNVYYNNNLYYIKSGSDGFFQRWNTNSATGYSTLAAAKASSNWNGKWDTNSVQADPLFTSLASNNLKPQSGSPACTMSTTGSYVGAIPCDGVTPPPPVNVAPTHGTPLVVASDSPINSTDATLYCYNTSTSDVDGDAVTNTYRWYRNNSLRSGLTSSSIASSNTAVGDVWKCEITPYDGKAYGTPKNSSTITIRAVPVVNTAPTHGTPIIRASDSPVNSTAATLYCYNQSTSDANGDTVTNTYRWYRNNSLRSGLTSSSIASSNTAVGDVWKCEITPYDGHDYGIAKNSSTIVIHPVPVSNVAPTHGTPIIRASDSPINSTAATLYCYNQSTVDANGDTVTNNYKWYRNNILRPGLTSSSLSAGNTAVGEVWKCEITPYDGKAYGTPKNSSTITIRAVPVVNTPPTHGTPTIIASDNPDNTTDATLYCYNTATSDVDGDTVTNTYKWYKNNALIPGLTTNIVGPSNTATSDAWKCEVTPYDGTAYGTPKNSTAITIRAANIITPTDITACVLTSKSWNEDSNLNNVYDLTTCFDDPLSHTLIYTASGNSSIRVRITNGIVSLSAPTNWNGAEHIMFKATDSSNNSRHAFTNDILLTVHAVADCGDNVCDAQESCSSCTIDCGSCPIIPTTPVTPAKTSGGGGGGSGSSSGSYIPTVNSNDTPTNSINGSNVNESSTLISDTLISDNSSNIIDNGFVSPQVIEDDGNNGGGNDILNIKDGSQSPKKSLLEQPVNVIGGLFTQDIESKIAVTGEFFMKNLASYIIMIILMISGFFVVTFARSKNKEYSITDKAYNIADHITDAIRPITDAVNPSSNTNLFQVGGKIINGAHADLTMHAVPSHTASSHTAPNYSASSHTALHQRAAGPLGHIYKDKTGNVLMTPDKMY